MQEREIEAVIEKAYYNEDEHKTVLKVTSDVDGATPGADARLRQQLEHWQGERGTTGILEWYSPYWGKPEYWLPC
jgi:hypothetical protein